MAKKNFLPIVICIFLFVNLCLATEVDTDSFSNDEIDTAETNMELDWWFGWYRHRWFHPWPFAHPPKPAGGFRHKFSHWPFVHPPKPAARSENPDSFSNDEIDTAETNMEPDWWFRWYHPWFHACSWPFVHPPMSAGGFCHKFPSHPWFKHPPRVSPSSKSEIATTEVKIVATKAGDKELDW
ncbi:hypothetical protein BC332_33482 [Capsicum chinense]|nr:hypothetical protein BC332_33482 [Capsicum chinense]